ncbi:hypothetical protein StoSoilB22_26360 [Arthrobacter sp. StoSoilB22]|jgi:hypothetical protein|nr:hypothetical protein StoSoilB22_26360 [Arthrobacter sp. StoSoilB22]
MLIKQSLYGLKHFQTSFDSQTSLVATIGDLTTNRSNKPASEGDGNAQGDLTAVE